MTSEVLLYAELGALRKGWGLRRPTVRNRIGPELRKLAGIDDTTSHADARDRMIAMLLRVFVTLPDELELAAKVMVAMEPGYGDATLTRRQERLAAVWNVDPVTVRRRCDRALELVSEHLAAQGSPPPPDGDEESFQLDEWYTLTSITTVRLDKPTPEATDVRTVVSLRDGLARVALGLGLPRPRSETRSKMGVEVEMQYGAELEDNRQPSAEYFVHYFRFPHPLAKGEVHTFSRTMRVPPGQLMAPHYVSWPLHRVDRFELRVKFDPRRPPAVAWRVSGIRYLLSEADGPGRDRLVPDSVGEVSVVFERLKPSFGYGVRWLA